MTVCRSARRGVVYNHYKEFREKSDHYLKKECVKAIIKIIVGLFLACACIVFNNSMAAKS